MAAGKVWMAKEAIIKFQIAGTITAGTALTNSFGSGTAVQAVMKDITITEPMGDIDKIDLLGTDASGYKNAEVEEKPASLAEVSGTLILPGDITYIESYIYDAGSAYSGFTRFSPGKASRRKLGILLNLTDGTDVVNFVLNNAYPTARDTKVTGADGHFETSFTAKCLPRDFYGPEML